MAYYFLSFICFTSLGILSLLFNGEQKSIAYLFRDTLVFPAFLLLNIVRFPQNYPI